MTAIDPFTTPAEAEREGHVKQVHDLLDRAHGVQHVVKSSYDGKSYHYNYGGGVKALLDAAVGQGYALMAVRDELADIAASLRTLAAAPTAVANVALAVNAVQETLTELGNDVCDVHTAIEEGSKTVADALDNVAEVIDRPRWWQWRRRWISWRVSKVLDARIDSAQDGMLVKLDDGFDAAAGLADVYERAGQLEHEHDGDFRVDLRQGRDPWDAADHDRWPLPSRRFRAQEGQTPWESAQQILPDLCERAGVPADPDQVYGQLHACDQDGTALWFIDTVFLPGATVISAPPEGF